MTKILKSALIALGLGAMTLTGLTAPAAAAGQISIGIKADKNTDEGKALTIFNAIVNGAAKAKIKQKGKKNMAGLNQKGKGNKGGIFQDCNGCSGSIGQNGNNNSQSLFQFGKGASSHVQQNGNNQAGTQIDFGF